MACRSCAISRRSSAAAERRSRNSGRGLNLAPSRPLSGHERCLDVFGDLWRRHMRFAGLRRVFFGAIALAAALAPGLANALSGEEQAALQHITAKLSSVQTMDGEFIQYN